MVKKMKIEETGDSDDLQALFDSIAAPAAQPRAETKPPKPPMPPADGVGDNDELQALFDTVAVEFAESEAAVSLEATGSEAVADDGEDGNSAVFTRIGQMTRQVHDTLRMLGIDSGAIQNVADVIPDARQRLNYIAQMTEQAASRVLNATDIAQPIQDKVGAGAEALQAKWDRLFAKDLSIDEFKALTSETRDFLGEVVQSSQATNAQLLEIMMAQDFQDLTGQVIKKVVEMAQTLETQLLQVLLEVAPAEKRTDANSGLMNGPVISSEGRDDVVTTQGQVDDLLESLGF